MICNKKQNKDWLKKKHTSLQNILKCSIKTSTVRSFYDNIYEIKAMSQGLSWRVGVSKPLTKLSYASLTAATQKYSGMYGSICCLQDKFSWDFLDKKWPNKSWNILQRHQFWWVHYWPAPTLQKTESIKSKELSFKKKCLIFFFCNKKIQ